MKTIASEFYYRFNMYKRYQENWQWKKKKLPKLPIDFQIMWAKIKVTDLLNFFVTHVPMYLHILCLSLLCYGLLLNFPQKSLFCNIDVWASATKGVVETLVRGSLGRHAWEGICGWILIFGSVALNTKISSEWLAFSNMPMAMYYIFGLSKIGTTWSWVETAKRYLIIAIGSK